MALDGFDLDHLARQRAGHVHGAARRPCEGAEHARVDLDESGEEAGHRRGEDVPAPPGQELAGVAPGSGHHGHEDPGQDDQQQRLDVVGEQCLHRFLGAERPARPGEGVQEESPCGIGAGVTVRPVHVGRVTECEYQNEGGEDGGTRSRPDPPACHDSHTAEYGFARSALPFIRANSD